MTWTRELGFCGGVIGALLLAGSQLSAESLRHDSVRTVPMKYRNWTIDKLDPRFRRQEVSYETSEPVGTVVVDTSQHFLYLVTGSGKALRYGIGVGKQGFLWKGTEVVTKKKEWPDWRPPTEMQARDNRVPMFMKGGPNNPLGARALYLGETDYRIHGTPQPWTIGTGASSGCVTMTNDDVSDLYNRVPVGTRVVVN
jgi:lipoprotein-anchoring transpeptidase ErfK/SrfK